MDHYYSTSPDLASHAAVYDFAAIGLRDTLFAMGVSSVHELIVKGRPSMLAQFVLSLMETERERSHHIQGRAVALVCAVVTPLVYLRDQKDWLLSVDVMHGLFALPTLERFAWDREDTWKEGVKREAGYFVKTYGKAWENIILPLQTFLLSFPGYDKGNLGSQGDRASEEYGQLTVQLFRTLGRLRLSR